MPRPGSQRREEWTQMARGVDGGTGRGAQASFKLARTSAASAAGGVFASLISLMPYPGNSAVNDQIVHFVFTAFLFLMVVSVVTTLIGFAQALAGGSPAVASGAVALLVALVGNVVALVETRKGVPGLLSVASAHHQALTVGSLHLSDLYVAIMAEVVVTGVLSGLLPSLEAAGLRRQADQNIPGPRRSGGSPVAGQAPGRAPARQAPSQAASSAGSTAARSARTPSGAQSPNRP